MGKVKQLWQDERDRQFQARVKELMDDGVSEDSACMQAAEEQEAEDDKHGADPS